MAKENRKGSRSKFKRVGMTEIPASDLARMGSMCAWEGCIRTFDKDMPPGWNWMLSFWAPGVVSHLAEIHPNYWLYDCALCPEHSQMFVTNFKRFKAEGA